MQRMFEGLTVLDCASFIAAPAAATILADFGAEVIKIEPPAGDPFRHLPRLPGNPKCEHNWAWMLESRNKQGLALDLSTADGQAVLCRMVPRADVFITNFPPAVRRRLGIAYRNLAPLNERLIYASFTGYGEHGQEANKPGFDSNAWWARSGMMDLVRPDSAGPPARSLPGMGDHPSALALFGAIVAALYRRERTGKGAHVGTSLMANGVWSNGLMVQALRRDDPQAPAARADVQCHDQSLLLPGWTLADPLAVERGPRVAGAARVPGAGGARGRSALRHHARPACSRARAERDLRRGVRRKNPG